jgi:hypothetical protein
MDIIVGVAFDAIVLVLVLVLLIIDVEIVHIPRLLVILPSRSLLLLMLSLLSFPPPTKKGRGVGGNRGTQGAQGAEEGVRGPAAGARRPRLALSSALSPCGKLGGTPVP